MTGLNPQQQCAVQAPETAVLVLAGAGTGKTKVITERIVWLINTQQIPPHRIVALTFTNKAAGEMKQRVLARIPTNLSTPWLGTFHSFGLQFLRKHYHRTHLKENFVLYDDDDQLSLLKRILKEDILLLEQFTPREAQSLISKFKQQLTTPYDYPESKIIPHLIKLWEKYHETLIEHNAVDFDDLISLPVQIIESHADIQQQLHRYITDILVDEYQDTNHAQFRLIQLLKGPQTRLFVVGDEDQCIYSWRGSDLSNILQFQQSFPEAKIYRLEQNYRSTKKILTIANLLVEKNINRLGKKLWTHNEEGSAVRFVWASNDEEEAEWVVNDILQHQYPLRHIAILFRTNNQSRPFEEALLKRGIPHIVIGGIRFYARKEVKDIIAYLRLLVNEHDDDALRRIINVPPRFIGNASVQRFEDYVRIRKCSLFQVLRDIEHDETFPARLRHAVTEFVHLIDSLKLFAQNNSISDTVKAIIDKTNYLEYIQSAPEREGRSREDILDEFLSICNRYSAKEKSVYEFLQELSLMTDLDIKEPQTDAIQLITCHSAKGLEFDYVYLTGLEEGLFPYMDEEESDHDLEEERRLCYVAMTRARKQLTLSGAQSRLWYGRTLSDRTISRFLFEIGLDQLLYTNLAESKKPKVISEPRFAETTNASSSKSTSPKYRLGVRVRHAKFGYGIVLNTEGSGDKMKVRVKFDSGKTAVLLASMAPMEIIERRKS